MNGIKLNKPKVDLFSFKEREVQLKKALSIKFTFLILLTNAFTFIFFQQSAPLALKKEVLQIKKNHIRILFPIESFIEIHPTKSTLVSLYTQSNQLLIPNAIIIKRHHTREQSEDLEQKKLYLIEVHEKQLALLLKKKMSYLKAYPSIKNYSQKKSNIIRKNSYEIIL